MFQCFGHLLPEQVLAFVSKKNDERTAAGESPYRFADLYHSANRTPVAVADANVSWLR